MAHSHRNDLVALVALALALLVAVLSSHGSSAVLNVVDAAPAAKVGFGELSVEGPTATLKDVSLSEVKVWMEGAGFTERDFVARMDMEGREVALDWVSLEHGG